MNEIIEKKPWQRREDESTKAFHAFILYRDMLPKERSIEKVRIKLGKSAGYDRHLENWSPRYEWIARAAAHDDHLDEVRAESQVHSIKEMSERQAKEGMALQKIGLSRFVNPDGTVNLDIVQMMDDRDAIRAVEVGAKIERQARGEPTEIVELQPLRQKRIEDYTDEELQWTLDHSKPIEARKEIVD